MEGCVWEGGRQILHGVGKPRVVVKLENVGVSGLVGLGWQPQLSLCSVWHRAPCPERCVCLSVCVLSTSSCRFLLTHPKLGCPQGFFLFPTGSGGLSTPGVSPHPSASSKGSPRPLPRVGDAIPRGMPPYPRGCGLQHPARIPLLPSSGADGSPARNSRGSPRTRGEPRVKGLQPGWEPPLCLPLPACNPDSSL